MKSFISLISIIFAALTVSFLFESVIKNRLWSSNVSDFFRKKHLPLKYSFVVVLFMLLSVNGAWGQLLQQDFSSSTTVASYTSATPNNGQFNSIYNSGAGTVLSINSGQLRFAKTANAGSFTRTTDFSPTPTALLYRFDFTVSGNSSALTNAGIFYVGSGFTGGNVNAETGHSRIGFNFTATAGQFSLRNIGGSTNSSNFSGKQTIVWAVNNSGASVSYKTPDNSIESVANDCADVWIGTTKVFNDIAAQSATLALTDIKFIFTAGTATVDIDNILIDPIPTTPTATAATLITSNSFQANWNAVSGVTGYQLDVSTASDFSSFVSGYNNLYVSGQDTNSCLVTGLSPSTTYYYRLRAASQYTVGEFASGNSGSINLTTSAGATPTITTTPTTLTDFGSQCINGTYGPNSFTINGSSLTSANVVVGALSGYTYSTTSGGTYTSSLSLTQSGGTYSQTIYVKFSPTAVQSYSGNISVGGGGASSVNVAATGSGLNTSPTVTTSAATSVASSAGTVPGTITDIGCSSITAYGVEYSTANGFANGAGTKVVGSNLSSGSFSVDLSGLTENTTYYYKTYATNGGGAAYSTQSSFTTLKNAPTTQASAITFSSVGSSSMNVNWTNGNGDGRIVLMNTSNSFTNPVDGTPQTAGTGQCIYSGTGSPVSVTGLSPLTTYYFRVYEYNNSSANIKYNTSTATNNPNSQTTTDGPCLSEGFDKGTTAPVGWTFTGITKTYATAGNYGSSSPSLQMEATNDAVTTSTISQASELKFWFKGQGTMTGSSLLVQGYNGSGWITVENITTIPTTGTTKTYNSSSSPTLPSGLSQFRFSYTKSSGNLAFDDVEIYCVSSPAIAVSPNFLSFTSNINTESDTQDVTVTGALLTTAPTYSISGTDAAMFSASGVLTTSGGIVSVSFTPTSDGSKNATLTITGEGGSIIKTVTLTGTGALEAPLAKDATNVSDHCFTANWEAVPGVSGYELSVYTKSGGNVSDLIISEYVEGSNGHKYIEIYNGTGASVGLSNYRLDLYANGSATVTASSQLSGTLENGNVIVYKNSSSTIYTGAATVNPSVNFNGNDAVALYKISSSSNVDIFGRIGEDPGSAWTSGSYSTVDKTLVRKSSVTAGITTNPTSGFPTLNTEWDIYSQDVVGFLGSHTMNSGSSKVQITGSPFVVTSATSQQICGLTPGTTYYYTVVAKDGSISSSSSNEITVNTLSGSAISVSPASLSDMDYNYGEGPSGSAIFYVTGLSLTNPISITAPADFEISTDGSVFLSAITLPTASGTPVYVRLKSGLPVANYYNENIVLTSGSASNSVSCNGTVTTSGIEINNIIDATSWNMSMPVSGTLKVYEKTTGTSGLATELFFSKYLEGESENKLLEIFNGTANTIVLTSHYKVQVFQIGSGGGAINWGASNVKTFELTGTLAPGETKVIYSKETNVSPSTTICSSDLFKSSWQEFLAPNKLLFNGNDPVRLLKDNAPIDIIGQSSGNAPSSPAYWGNASINTLRTFLVRNKTVTSGANAVAANTTSFATLNTEWTQEQDIAEGVSGATCDAIQKFGQYDYVEQYNQWVDIAAKRDPSDGVTNTNQVTIKDAASRPCEQLKAEILDAGNTVLKTNLFRVPIIVDADNTVGNIKYTDGNNTLIPDNICAECDIAVLGNATLTASTENKKFHNATVMQGAKLAVNNKLIVNDLILKAGYETGNPYINFPTATMKVDAASGLRINGTFKYVRKMDNSRWYFMSFPYDVKVSEISSVDGTIAYNKYMDPDGNSATGWYIKYWNGSGRANDRTVNGHWIGYNTTNARFTANSGYLKADSGYIFALNTGTKEVVFPLKRSFTLAKEADKIINLKTYKNGTPDPIQDSYHNNWNLIGAPFLSKFTGYNTKIKSNNEVPFGTIYVLDNTTNTYTAMSFADFALKPMNPFGCYFIQSNDDMASQGLNFSSIDARMLAPRKTQEAVADNVRVFCTTETGEDYINLILDENENANYNFGSDLVKWFYTGTSKPQVYVTQGGIDLAFDAVNYDAAQNIPVTVYSKSAGNVLFKSGIMGGTGLSKLILTDNVTGDNTDLLTSDYTCTVSGGITTNRFFLSAQRIATGESISLINGVVIVAKNGTIFVRNAPAGSLVEVFDAVGRQMAGKLMNSNNTELTINAHGVYMVRVIKENSSIIQKIIL